MTTEKGEVTPWLPIETAGRVVGRRLGIVDGEVRIISWGKTSHVPMHGWILVDQGPEDADLCSPTHWMPLPTPPATYAKGSK